MLVLGLLCCLCASVLADDTAQFYSAGVVVPNQARETQNNYLPRAYEQVLIKLSGQRSLPETVTVESLGTRARSSLLSVTYHQYTMPMDDGEEFTELRLQAQFDADSADNALAFLGLPRWPLERSRFQLIMAIEKDNERRLISSSDAFLAFILADTAEQRGLPLEVALEPADEEFDISWLQEIWGGFTDTALEETMALGFDGVVLVAATRRNGRWQLRWSMATTEREWSWNIREDDLQMALVEGVHAAADRMSASQLIDPTEQGKWLETLEIANINNDHDYLRSMGYLQDLNFVNQVRILSAQGPRMRFQLELNAAPEYLHKSIGRGGILVMVGASVAAGAKVYELTR